MKYNQIVNKIRSVVYSCETNEQLDVACKYSFLLIDNYFIINKNDNIDERYDKIFLKNEMYNWLKFITVNNNNINSRIIGVCEKEI